MKNPRLIITLAENLIKLLDKKSKELGVSKAAVISLALTEYFKK